MTREIKFRAWDTIDQRMTDIPFAIVNNRGDRDPEYWKQLPWMIVKPARHWVGVATSRYIPMQYTGLKDAKGVEIYEGDMVKYDYNSTPIEHCISLVTFDEEWGCWKFGIYMLEPTIKKTLEVIGNIYENGNLLK